MEISATDSASTLIDSFKTARKLLKQPVDYSDLNEVHSRCKMIMDNLGNTLNAFEHCDNLQGKNNQDVGLPKSVSSKEKNYEKKLVTTKKNRRKRKCNIKEENKSPQEFEVKKVAEPASPIHKKKRRTFRPFKERAECSGQPSLVQVLTKAEEIQQLLPANTLEYPALDHQNSFSCEALATGFSPLTATNTWELLQLRRMIEDPFLSATRKQYLHNRILELNNNIIQDLLKQAEQSDQSEFYVLDKLYKMSTSESISPEQKQQVECVFAALRDKVVSGVMKDAGESDSGSDYSKTIEKLHALLQFPWIPQTEKGRFIERVMEIRSKMANGLGKQSHVPIEDGVRLLERIRLVMKDPFLPQESKAKLMHKVKYLRNTTIAQLTSAEIPHENDTDLVNKLNSMLQDPFLAYHKRLAVVSKIKAVEEKASQELKLNKVEVKEKLMTAMDEILGFQGTNLDFVVGYGVQNPQYVRCIHIWNPQPRPGPDPS